MAQPATVTLLADGKPAVVRVCFLYAKPGFESLVQDELLSLIQKSRLEAGCIHFDLYKLVENRFYYFMHEVWESRDALETHLTSYHTTWFRTAVAGYLERPIEIYEIQEID